MSERWQRAFTDPKNLPFFAVHLAALAVFWVPFSWTAVALCLGFYLLRMFAITAGYHRYFSHRTFKTSRGFQFVLACLGTMAMQRGPLWWSAHHRHHHVHSDDEEDIHSPGMRGFFWAHVGWILAPDHQHTDVKRVRDLAEFPELRWLDRYYAVPGALAAVALFLAGGWSWFIWGFCMSTVLTWHATFCINSLTHVMGVRRYRTDDDSRNSLILALITLGEGWHNNHHYYKASTRQGFFWWEIDISYYALRSLAACGIVWDLREPPRKLVQRDRIAPKGLLRLLETRRIS